MHFFYNQYKDSRIRQESKKIKPHICSMVILDDKERYKTYCSQHMDRLPVFYMPQWLDAVCIKGEWGVRMVEEGGNIRAIFPFHLRKKYGLGALVMPQLTPYLGIWMSEPTSEENFRTYAKALTASLPRVFYTSLCFHPGVVDWLPWKWMGYLQQSRYTYRILGQTTSLFESSLGTKLNNHIQYASSRLTLTEEKDVDALYELITDSFGQQGLRVPFSREFVNRINTAQGVSAVIRLAKDNNGVAQAGILTVEDSLMVYNLLSGRRKDAVRGAMPYVLYVSIISSLAKGKNFDFEGSSIKGIAAFFKSFGGTLTPFNHIFGTSSRLTDALLFAIGKFKG
ncbi:MAG: hypothetical protein IPN29_05005 [Saprospiraceae bacterium]|nr:hypothetical protein [Saprospiraceae bacterium]